MEIIINIILIALAILAVPVIVCAICLVLMVLAAPYIGMIEDLKSLRYDLKSK